MKTPFLNKLNIQIADLALHYDVEQESCFLVYAPLAGIYMLADADMIAKLESEAALPGSNCEVRDLLEQFSQNDIDYSDRIVKNPKDFDSMTILPNLICNLHCSYCYSAKGRSNIQLDFKTLKNALDFFINRDRTSAKHLSLFISGGGEPLISWEVVRNAIKYSRDLAAQNDFSLEIMLMTNATLITPEIASELRRYDINVGVSFEIIKDIQNLQRGKYDIVHANLHTLLGAGIQPSISSVITPVNVDRMEEMVDTVISNYSGVRHLNFDPAMSKDLFSCTEDIDKFYDKFLCNFFKVKRKCNAFNITLDCNLIRKSEKLFPRYCQGKFALTPEGKISICHSISSPLETSYSKAIYGEIRSDGKVIFDIETFSNLINPVNFLMDKCSECIARWHCSGGCLMYRYNYDEEYMESVCRFTAKAITEILLRRLENTYKEEEGMSLEELLNAKKLIE